jgi:LPS export ABC transporter protein LptC
MLLLAGMGACSGVGSPDGIRSAHMAADTADQVMYGVNTVLTNLGVKQADLVADSARMYENAGRTELRHVKLTFFSTAGVQQSVLTADEGTYMMRSDAMEARGNVVVVKTDGTRLTTTLLRYDKAKNEVSTDQPYDFDSPTKGHGHGDRGFTSDPSFSNITTYRATGTARGGFVLPGQ